MIYTVYNTFSSQLLDAQRDNKRDNDIVNHIIFVDKRSYEPFSITKGTIEEKYPLEIYIYK